jgi:hypothetical protein
VNFFLLLCGFESRKSSNIKKIIFILKILKAKYSDDICNWSKCILNVIIKLNAY